MKLIAGTEQEYKNWFEKNDDPYSRRIFTYAEDWAKFMEDAMVDENVDSSQNASVLKFIVDNAERFSRIADTDGITGFMYGASVSVLSKCWVHGEELRRWHNLKTQIGTEGEKANESGGVLNPALMKVGR